MMLRSNNVKGVGRKMRYQPSFRLERSFSSLKHPQYDGTFIGQDDLIVLWDTLANNWAVCRYFQGKRYYYLMKWLSLFVPWMYWPFSRAIDVFCHQFHRWWSAEKVWNRFMVPSKTLKSSNDSVERCLKISTTFSEWLRSFLFENLKKINGFLKCLKNCFVFDLTLTKSAVYR